MVGPPDSGQSNLDQFSRRDWITRFIGSCGLLGLSGCIEGGSSDVVSSPLDLPDGEESYEHCPHIVIPYSVLPEELRHEVDEAREQGRYEDEHVELGDAMDVEHGYIRIDEDPYKPRITETDDGEALEIQMVDAVRARGPVSVDLINEDDQEHQATVTLTEGGTELVEESTSISPDGKRVVELTDKFGDYTLRVDLESAHPQTPAEFAFTISTEYFGGSVSISPDEITLARDVSDLTPCSWYEL